MQAGAITDRIPIVTKRIPVDLTSIEIDQRPSIRVLKLQDRLLHFSARGPDFNRDTVADLRAQLLAPCGAGGDGGFRAAALLVAGVEIDVEVALVDDVGVTESCGCGDGAVDDAAVEICAECGDGAGGGDGGGACGVGDGDSAGPLG